MHKPFNEKLLHSEVNLHTKQCNMPALKICLLINLFVCTSALCQDSLQSPAKEKQILFVDTRDTSFVKQSLLPGVHAAAQQLRTLIQILPQQFYYNSIGFFCKKELQLEKSVKLPLKIRLGSVGYTDKMEGKGQLMTVPLKK